MKVQKHENQFFSRIQIYMKKYKILNSLKYIMYYFDKFLCVFIKKGKKELNSCEQVLILANMGMGDAINFLAVADKYRRMFPKDKFKINVWVPNHLDELIKKETDFDNVEAVNFNVIATNLKKRYKLIKKIRSNYYDYIIDIMGIPGCSPSFYLMSCASSSNKITILNKANSTCPKYLYSKIYDEIVTINDSKISNVQYYNILVNKLLGEDSSINFHKVGKVKLNLDLPKEYFIVFPGASSDFKKWGINKYSDLVERIYDKTHLPLVLGGTISDKIDNQKLIDNINIPYYDVTGKTSIIEFIELIKRAKFIITNDTGAYHIAVNEEIPVTLIASNSFIQYISYDFKEFNLRKPYIVCNKKYKCKNCHDDCKKIKNGETIWPCLNDISVDEAWKKVEIMLKDCDIYEKG